MIYTHYSRNIYIKNIKSLKTTQSPGVRWNDWSHQQGPVMLPRSYVSRREMKPLSTHSLPSYHIWLSILTHFNNIHTWGRGERRGKVCATLFRVTADETANQQPVCYTVLLGYSQLMVMTSVVSSGEFRLSERLKTVYKCIQNVIVSITVWWVTLILPAFGAWQGVTADPAQCEQLAFGGDLNLHAVATLCTVDITKIRR